MGKWLGREFLGVHMWMWTGFVLLLIVGGVSVGVGMNRETPEYVPHTFAPMATIGPKPVVLFVGDSYTAGTGDPTWASIVSKDLGWRMVNEALGGTGYVTTASTDGCGKSFCPTYLDVIQSVTAQPSIVLINGGRNDSGRGEDYASQVTRTIEAAASRWPDARVVVTTPLWDSADPPAWFGQSRRDVRAAATAAGVEYLNLGEPLRGHPALIKDDGVHPNAEGQKAIASASLASWTR